LFFPLTYGDDAIFDFGLRISNKEREREQARLLRTVIADNLSKAGRSLGYVSAIDSNGGTIWIADAQRSDGKRFVVRADELLTAFVELESQLAVEAWISRKGVFRACGGMYD